MNQGKKYYNILKYTILSYLVLVVLRNLVSLLRIKYKGHMVKIMNTQQYASEIYHMYSKTNTASQQLIRRMIKNNKALPQVVHIDRVGRNGYFLLLHVEV